MSSNLLSAILCPKCGKKLELWWSRNDMEPEAHCPHCTYESKIPDLTLLFLIQYYKQKEGIKD